jgi:hypothetical protein
MSLKQALYRLGKSFVRLEFHESDVAKFEKKERAMVKRLIKRIFIEHK